MDRNFALRRKFAQYHILCVDMPTPQEAKRVLQQLKNDLGPAGIKSTKFREILFDPAKRRFSVIAGRDGEEQVTTTLLNVIRNIITAGDATVVETAHDIEAYQDSFIPEPFLKWPAHGVYVGLREDAGDTFTYVSILNHFGVTNLQFKTFLATSLHGPLQIGTSWDAKLLYVGGPDKCTVDTVIDIFHTLRVQMIRDLDAEVVLAQAAWDLGQDAEAGVRRWVAESADADGVDSLTEEEMAKLWDTKQEVEDDLLQLD